ncbi:hypothetical protein NP493_346g01001 [Ridgeia piscesae]|uniref:LRRCT domain-containing protein n=1 Tax=Ridgeia piscesae TaxID=27915 RepID=A0AAD9L3B0_RIDPI|nr:hypothetical protein NP493_346g01001 [Ridgeia piscesae]
MPTESHVCLLRVFQPPRCQQNHVCFCCVCFSLLNANRITCVRKDTFQDLHNLNLLSLYDNKIQSLANGTFDPLANIQTLHLARNPFICDCNLQWLAEYLHSHPIETSGARCDSPRRMRRKKIGHIRHSKFKCKGKLYLR